MNRIGTGQPAPTVVARAAPCAVRVSSLTAVVLGVLMAAIVRPAASAQHFHAELSTDPAVLTAGVPVELSFTVRDSLGGPVRFLQFVHERPLHLIAVSRDLAEFAHIHPELALGDSYRVSHVFNRGGDYRLFAGYTPPGSGPIVDSFDVTVAGRAPDPSRPAPDARLAHTVAGVRVTLAFDHSPRADADVMLTATLSDSMGTTPITDLQLYLGALAHFIIVSEDLKDFIHAHPLETGEIVDPSLGLERIHVHDVALLAKVLKGPSPATIRAATSFPRAGRYKLWMQFQRAGDIITVPFVFDVAAAPKVAALPGAKPPSGAIQIIVSAAGYSPARIDLQKGVPAVLAFSRPQAGNCGGTLVIPGLNIRKDLPVGGTAVVRFTPRETAEIPFSCGMGMMQGLIVVK